MPRPHPSPRTAVVGVLLAVVALLLAAPGGAASEGSGTSVSHRQDHSAVSAAVAPAHRVVAAKRVADVPVVDAAPHEGVQQSGASAPSPAAARGPAPVRGSPARDRAPPA